MPSKAWSREFLLPTGVLLVVLMAGCASAEDQKPSVPPWRAAHVATVEKTASLTENEAAGKLAERHGLEFVNVTWEDTGRYKNSSVGPNISDMTIQSAASGGDALGRGEPVAMPVLRHPNFSDKTADLDPQISRCWWAMRRVAGCGGFLSTTF